MVDTLARHYGMAVPVPQLALLMARAGPRLAAHADPPGVVAGALLTLLDGLARAGFFAGYPHPNST